MVWQETLLITTVFFVVTEQRPPIIFVDPETELLEEIRPIRSINHQNDYSVATSISSQENPGTTTVIPEDIIRELRSTNDREDAVSSEATTVLNPEIKTTENSRKVRSTNEVTTISSDDATTTEDNEGFFAIFVKISGKTMENPIEKRSVDYLDEVKKDSENLEDLDTAANTVFRPLFAYRQQNEQRRRLRTLRNSYNS